MPPFTSFSSIVTANGHHSSNVSTGMTSASTPSLLSPTSPPPPSHSPPSIPLPPTTPSPSSSVFARLTGRRHPNPTSPPPPLPTSYPRPSTAHDPAGGEEEEEEDAAPPSFLIRHEDRTSTSSSTSTAKEKSRRFGSGHHRRESSLLSLTNSVTDLTRSVSLRSHRTSSSSAGRGSRHLSSAGNLLSSFSSSTSNTTTSPVESSEEPHFAALNKRSQTATTPSHTRAKPSLSVRTLTHKFKSSDALNSFTTVERPTTNGHSHERKLSAAALLPPRLTSASMLANLHANPAQSTRPPLPMQMSSYGMREMSSIPSVPALQRSTTANSTASGAPAPLSIYQQIQETAAKRCATIEYLRQVHEGDVFYFGMYHYSAGSLSHIPSLQPHKLGRRATNYFILGYSLPAILDQNSNSPLEYLRALALLLQEFETYQSLSGYDSSGSSLSRGRVAGMLKSGMSLGNRSGRGRRSSTAESLAMSHHHHNDPRNSNSTTTSNGTTTSSSTTTPILPSSATTSASTANPFFSPAAANPDGAPSSAIDTSEFGILSSPHPHHHHADLTSPIVPTGLDFSHLLTPHLPFEPDFPTTLAALCDTLRDVYMRLADLVAAHGAALQQNLSIAAEHSSSASPSGGGAAAASPPESGAGGGPPNGSSAAAAQAAQANANALLAEGPLIAEAFAKADKALRKIFAANSVREFEEASRAGVRTEVAGLGKLILGGLM